MAGSVSTTFTARPVAASTQTVVFTAPLESVTVVKNGDPWHVEPGTTAFDADLDAFETTGSVTDDAPVTGTSYADERGTDDDWYYLRVQQAARPGSGHVPGGAAWVGPIWVRVTGS